MLRSAFGRLAAMFVSAASPAAMPSSEFRLRAVGLATFLAGLLPVRLAPGVVVAPWSAEALAAGASLAQVMAPAVVGTSLVVVAGLYGNGRLRPPYGAVVVFGLWALAVGCVGSSPFMARTLVGGPLSRIDANPLWVVLALAACATGLEMGRLDSPPPAARRIQALGALMLFGTYLLPTPAGFVGEQVARALAALPEMPLRSAAAAFPFRLADLTPLLSGVAVVVWLFRAPPPWLLPWILHGLAVCIALAGLVASTLYADVPAGLAWLRSALLCAAAVEGIQWSLVREAKAMAKVPDRRRFVMLSTAVLALVAVGLGWWLALPNGLPVGPWRLPTPAQTRVLMEGLPSAVMQSQAHMEHSRNFALSVRAELSRAFHEEHGVLRHADALVAGADLPLHKRGLWQQRVNRLNQALRGVGLPFYAHFHYLPLGPDGSLGVSFRLMRIHVRYRHPGPTGPYELLVAHAPGLVDSGSLEVGRVHTGSGTAIVDLGAVRAQAGRRALSLFGDSECGFGHGPYLELDRSCGQLVLRALSPKPRARPSLERLEEALTGALVQVSARHELQHQLDLSHYVVPTLLLAQAPDVAPAALLRIALEGSAQLAEYCTSEPLEQALAFTEQIAHLAVWDTPDSPRAETSSPEALAAQLALQLLALELGLEPQSDPMDAVLNALVQHPAAYIGAAASRAHERHFSTPCAVLPAVDRAPAFNLPLGAGFR